MFNIVPHRQVAQGWMDGKDEIFWILKDRSKEADQHEILYDLFKTMICLHLCSKKERH